MLVQNIKPVNKNPSPEYSHHKLKKTN